MSIQSKILALFRRLGVRRPYFDITGTDGSLYMGRWWIFGGSNPQRDDRGAAQYPHSLELFSGLADEIDVAQLGWTRSRLDAWVGSFAAGRLHHIAREDRARDFHTHPASFISVVLSGWYRERRPIDQAQHYALDRTNYFDVVRRPGSIAFRRGRDRHTIAEVSPGGAWTLVIWLRKDGSWGFAVEDGRLVNWRDYEVQP